MHLTTTQVTFDSHSVSRPADFGAGLIPPVRLSGPTLADLAWHAGYTVALDLERPVDPPAGLSQAEAVAFAAGVEEAGRAIQARYDAWADELAMEGAYL